MAQSYVEATLVGLREAIAGVEPPDSGHAAELIADCSTRVERLLTSM